MSDNQIPVEERLHEILAPKYLARLLRVGQSDSNFNPLIDENFISDTDGLIHYLVSVLNYEDTANRREFTVTAKPPLVLPSLDDDDSGF